MTEAELQRSILDLAALYGWLVYHARPGMMRSGKWATPLMGNPGYPDLTLATPGRTIYAELKGYDARGRLGQLTPEQWEWLYVLQHGPCEAYLWAPDDMDEIIETLKETHA